MKRNEFHNAIVNTPRIVPVFTVTRVPKWAKDQIAKGDKCFWQERPGVMAVLPINGDINQSRFFDLQPSHVKFDAYKVITRMNDSRQLILEEEV